MVKLNRFQSLKVATLILISSLMAEETLASTLPTSDFQYWNQTTAIGPLTEKTRYWLEEQARVGNDVSRLSQMILRPGFGYVLSENGTIWLGFAYIYTQFPFAPRRVDENRIWQQFLWIRDYDWGRVFSRTRLEQRFLDTISTTGWRFRQFARVQISFKNNEKAFISTMEELFVHINNTLRQGSNRGFDQNRFFVGIGFFANKNTLMEVGYQNQYIRRINSQNYFGSYLATNVIFNF
jgi:Protein of unknown function (DUF2490)